LLAILVFRGSSVRPSSTQCRKEEKVQGEDKDKPFP
jgi:hypothetical protein